MSMFFRDESYWSNIIFGNESKLNIFDSDDKTMIWRKPYEEDLKSTFKHGEV